MPVLFRSLILHAGSSPKPTARGLCGHKLRGTADKTGREDNALQATQVTRHKIPHPPWTGDLQTCRLRRSEEDADAKRYDLCLFHPIYSRHRSITHLSV